MRDRSQQINRRRRNESIANDGSPVPETIFEDTVQVVTETPRPRFGSRRQLYQGRETQSSQIVRQPRRNPYRAPENPNRSNLRRFYSQSNLIQNVTNMSGPTNRSSYSGSTPTSSRYYLIFNSYDSSDMNLDTF